jgi:hypothetical protein
MMLRVSGEQLVEPSATTVVATATAVATAESAQQDAVG